MDDRIKYMRMLYAIIKRMNLAIGARALETAKGMKDIEFSWSDDIIGLKTDGYYILNALMVEYQKMLGPFAYEVARSAVEGILLDYPELRIPEGLCSRSVKLARYAVLKHKLEQKDWWH